MSGPLFDARAEIQIQDAPSDRDAAAKVLVLLAAYLRRREVVPDNLADVVAEAVDAAMRKPAKSRGRALTDALHLTEKPRRPENWLEIGAEVARLRDEGMAPAKAAERAAAAFGIEPEIARKCWKKLSKAARASDPGVGHEAP